MRVPISVLSWTLALRFVALTILYTLALVLVVGAYRAQTKEKTHFQINFEYKVF